MVNIITTNLYTAYLMSGDGLLEKWTLILCLRIMIWRIRSWKMSAMNCDIKFDAILNFCTSHIHGVTCDTWF